MDWLMDVWKYNADVIRALGLIALFVVTVLFIIWKRHWFIVVETKPATKTTRPRPIAPLTPPKPQRPIAQVYPLGVHPAARPLGKPMTRRPMRHGVVIETEDGVVIDDSAFIAIDDDDVIGPDEVTNPDEVVLAEEYSKDEPVTAELNATAAPATPDVPDVSTPDRYMADYGTGRSGDEHTERGSDCAPSDCSHDCRSDCSSDCSSGGD